MPPAKKSDMKKFQDEIEDIVWMKDVSYLDAIMMFCEENDFEVEKIPRILSSSLKSKLREEAEDLSLLKTKSKRLPL